MDFDEYEYLEKAVEEPGSRNDSSGKKDGDEKTRSRSSRRREEEGGDGGGDQKKSRLDGENGERRDEPRSERHDRDRHRSGRDVERESERDRNRDKGRGGRDREKERDKEKEREREKDKERERSRRSSSHSRRHRNDDVDEVEPPRARSRDRDLKEREREIERESTTLRAKSRDREAKEKEREIERERRARSKDRETKEKERELERESRARSREREAKEREREIEREMRAKSRDREPKEREHEIERENSRRYKDKKEAVEPEADPERDQRTVFAYQMPLKATERDVYEFFSKAGKVRDVRLIMDRNSRRSKGVGYVEFYDAMSVPMAIALSGHHLLGQPVMVKPSEAEKNLVQSTVVGGGAGVLAGPYGAVARKLYVGNLHFNMTEDQLRQVFEPFGLVELVQLPLDLETGLCKGFGFVQFAQLEHAKAAQSLNGKLEIAGRVIKVSAVTDHLGVQNTGTNAADFDDDDGGGLSLNAQSRAMLMQKLDRSGIATSVAGSLGVPLPNGTVPNQLPVGQPMSLPGVIPAPVPPAVVLSPIIAEPIGNPSVCLLLKNMFDPAAEMDPDFDIDIKEDVQEECSRYGTVKHIYVDKLSAGHVYLKFETVAAAAGAQHAMHLRWFAGRRILAVYMVYYIPGWIRVNFLLDFKSENGMIGWCSSFTF